MLLLNVISECVEVDMPDCYIINAIDTRGLMCDYTIPQNSPLKGTHVIFSLCIAGNMHTFHYEQ